MSNNVVSHETLSGSVFVPVVPKSPPPRTSVQPPKPGPVPTAPTPAKPPVEQVPPELEITVWDTFNNVEQALAHPDVSPPRTPAKSAGKSSVLPLLSIETTAPPQINTGKTAAFRIVVRNLGDVVASGVVTQTSWPKPAKLVSSEPKAETVTDSHVTFPVRDLPPRSEAVYIVELACTARGDLDVVTNVRFDTQTQTRLRVCRPSLMLDFLGPREIRIGESTALKFGVVNDGDGPAHDLKFQVAPVPGATIDLPDQEVGRLMPGESRQLPVRVVPSVAGPMTVKFVATSAEGLETTSEKQLHVLSPKLTVEVRGPKTGLLTKPLNYTLHVRNDGDLDAENVRLRVAIPPHLKVTEVGQFGDLDRKSNSLTWALRKIAAGESGEVSFRVVGEIEGRQNIGIDIAAQPGVETHSHHVVDVVGRPDLVLDLDYHAGQLALGEETMFDVTVKNRGTKAAKNVQIQIVLPEGLQLVEPGTGGGLYFAPFSLAPEEVQRRSFRVVGRAPGDQIVRGFLRSDDIPCEIRHEESVFYYATN